MNAKEFLENKQSGKKQVPGWHTIATPELLEEYAEALQPKWIKIESEDDLPKESCYCWVGINKSITLMYFVASNRYFSYEDNSGIEKWNNLEYYMPITKPQPPKE